MRKYNKTMEYEEEDGWEITHDGMTCYVYGNCEANVTWLLDPATRSDPFEDLEVEVEGFEVYDVEVCDINGDILDVELTAQEKKDFESHMRAQLDDLIDSFDRWQDYESVPDYDDDEW